MYCVQKSTLNSFQCGSEDVCRIKEGSTNDYLLDKRVVEEFLAVIEPQYNTAISNFRNGNFTADSIFVIAGFASFIMSCAPTAMRINSDYLAKTVESQAAIMEKMRTLPPPPKELGGTSMTDLLQKGLVKVNVDDKYPQAIGIAGLYDRTIKFGNSEWDILINEDPYSPFFTSDFPIAIEHSEDPRILNRIMPLAPDIAIRIRPTFAPPPRKDADQFPMFSARVRILNHQEIRKINTLIVQCADEQVYYRDDKEWVMPFISKNAGYWIEPITARIPTHKGELIWSSMRITRR